MIFQPMLQTNCIRFWYNIGISLCFAWVVRRSLQKDLSVNFFFEEETLNEKRFKWFLEIVLFYVDAIREKFFFLEKKTPNDETLFLPRVKN